MGRSRIDATVTPQQQQAVEQIAIETGLSSSAVVSEAVSLYLTAYMEAKRGHRLVTLDPETQRPACALVTPTLSAMEWAGHIASVKIAPEAVQAVQAMIDDPPAPNAALREAMRKRKREP